jgi:hypothetical protein
MKLTEEEGNLLVYGDLEGWESVEEKMVDNGRWNIYYEGVFKHIESNKFYSTGWSLGATENQWKKPFEYEEPTLTEVHQVEKIVKVWEPVGKKTKEDHERDR